MKICILTPRFLYPQYGGDALRINEIVRHLKEQGHTLILVSPSDETEPPIEQAHELYNKVYFVKRNRVTSLVMGIKHFICGKPIQCGYYYSNSYRELLKKVIAKESLTSTQPLCLFIGSYFPPNVQGIERFVKKVLPHVNIRLKIVGKGMAKLKEHNPLFNDIEIVCDAPVCNHIS